MKHASIQSNLKKYFGLAHKFLLHNKFLFLMYFAFFALTIITPFFYQAEPSVYGTLVVLDIIALFFIFKYGFLIPQLIFQSGGKMKLTKHQLIGLHKNQNWKSIKFAMFVFIPFLLIFLVYIILTSLLFGMNFTEGDFYRLNTEVGFYPRDVIDTIVLTLLFAPLYTIPIFYFVENNSLKNSFKKGVRFTIQHKHFILPAIGIFVVYWTLSYLFIHRANFYALPFRIFIESYLGLLITVAIYYYYRDHSGAAK